MDEELSIIALRVFKYNSLFSFWFQIVRNEKYFVQLDNTVN